MRVLHGPGAFDAWAGPEPVRVIIRHNRIDRREIETAQLSQPSRILIGYQTQPGSGQPKRAEHAALSQELTSHIEVLLDAPVAAAPPHVAALDGPIQIVGAVSGK